MRGIHGLLAEGRAYVPAAQSGQGRYSGARLCGAAMIFVVALAGLLQAVPTAAQAPGPNSFAREPRTPLELWSAIDYLARTGQSKKAVPYLERFTKSQPDDATLIEIRDRYGIGSVLRLLDEPATRPRAQLLADKLALAGRRHATQPERIARAIEGLTGTFEEQEYALSQLRQAGPDAVPFWTEALQRPSLSPAERSLLAANLGRLDRSVVPPLLAVLESGDTRLAADAARALGQIGDSRAVPYLTYPASAIEFDPAVREAAQAAIASLTGRSFEVQSRAPAQVLADAAWQLHRHQAEFPGDPVIVWVWDQERHTPAPRLLKRNEAESALGLRLARQAARLQPQDRSAQSALVSLTLQQALDRTGLSGFPAQDKPAFAQALSAGPDTVAEVLRTAIADGKDELAAAAAIVLGQLSDASALAVSGHPHPLVDALFAPGAHTQLAAARALVAMAPARPFPGSNRVVPTLARFVTAQQAPWAVVIDGNPNRGSQLSGALRGLGYETVLETEGDLGFLAAAETADVELVMVSLAQDRGAWSLIDVLTNLKNDGRTASLPVYVYGPLGQEIRHPNLTADFPAVKFLVQPVDSATLEKLLGGRPAKLSEADRLGYAREAATLLARIATAPRSPLAADLSAVEPALTFALNQPATSLAASTALGDVPSPDAQRSLADAAIDPARPIELRQSSAAQLARSIRRFGPLVSADQETQLAALARAEGETQLQTALQTVVAALQARVPARKIGRSPVSLPAGPETGVAPGAETRPTIPAPAAPPAPVVPAAPAAPETTNVQP
ncbi:MAG: HEAT repeat domain-containing protein [Isosphaeraceae bacterium]